MLSRLQLRCRYPRLEWEQLLEQHRTLQDTFDQMQAEAKFDADQAKRQLQDGQQEIQKLKTQLTVSALIISTTTIFHRCGLFCSAISILYIYL